MTAGFQLMKPGSGAVLIDQNYANLALRAKGSVATWEARSYFGYTGTVTVPGARSVIAFRCPVPTVLQWSEPSGDSTIHRFSSAQPATVDYWVFDDAQYGVIYDGTQALFQVFKAGSTELAFDSRMRYMKFMGMIFAGKDLVPGPYTYGGAKPALIQASHVFEEAADIVRPGPFPEWAFFLSGIYPSTSGSSVSFSAVSGASGLSQSDPPSYYASAEQTAFTVIDVLNM